MSIESMGGSRSAEVAATRLKLQRLGVSPADLLADVARPPAPMFAGYVPHQYRSTVAGMPRTDTTEDRAAANLRTEVRCVRRFGACR